MNQYPTEFRVTEAHLKLMRRMYVGWDGDAYDGAPAIDIKRPYGNSDVAADVLEIVFPDEHRALLSKGDYINGERSQELLTIHRETQFSLQIALATGTFATGLYTRTEKYDTTSWVRVGD